MMVAIPLTIIVRGEDEQVGAFEGFQRVLPGRCRVEQNRIAKGTAQTFKDGCPQEEVLDALGLPMQDLLKQVVKHETMRAGEGVDEACWVRKTLHGERGQLQAGNP